MFHQPGLSEMLISFKYFPFYKFKCLLLSCVIGKFYRYWGVIKLGDVVAFTNCSTLLITTFSNSCHAEYIYLKWRLRKKYRARPDNEFILHMFGIPDFWASHVWKSINECPELQGRKLPPMLVWLDGIQRDVKVVFMTDCIVGNVKP